jgi:hypothetical protein
MAALPNIIPATALGLDARPAASERIVMAHIGMGWFGTVDLKIFLECPQAQNVAVCDVDAAKAAAAKDIADARYGNRDCKIYHDFREMLDRDDIDAVSIATPDHWHAIPTIEACRRGKDVHIEKPLSLTIEQGRAMVEAARRYGRVVQTGSEVRLHQCPPGGHERGDFLTAVRTRAKPGADVEIGHRTVTVSHLAHIAYRLNRPLRWDPVKEEFPGDEEANRMRGRSMRAPWRL